MTFASYGVNRVASSAPFGSTILHAVTALADAMTRERAQVVEVAAALARHVDASGFMVAIIGWILLAVGAFVSLANLALIVRWYVTRTGGSLIPLLGGTLAFVGCALLPVGWRLGLIAFAIDPSCAWMCAWAVVAALRR